MPDEDENHFMSHPAIMELVSGSLHMMRLESDRGAVLIAAEIINSALAYAFQTVLPDGYGKKKTKSLFEYPSALSALSGKIELAYAVRIIRYDVYHSATILRKLRNEAAHSDKTFKLDEHKNRLEEVLEVARGGTYFAKKSAYEIITAGLYESIRSNESTRPDGKPLFASWEEFIDYMAKSDEFISMVEEQAPRVSLNVGVTILCGL